jgi:PKD repeat protein
MTKATTTLLLLLLLLTALSSCKNAPVACFTVTTPSDSIKVGTTVIFNAGCSSDATAYYWDFGNGKDTTSIVAQTTYSTVATYPVALVVGNSGKSASVTKSVVVLP